MFIFRCLLCVLTAMLILIVGFVGWDYIDTRLRERASEEAIAEYIACMMTDPRPDWCHDRFGDWLPD